MDYIVEFLKQTGGFFRELNDEELGILAAVLKQENHDPGATIFKEGTPGDALFIIMEGQVKIYKDMAPGKKLLSTLGRGDIFGEMSVFDTQARSASAIAGTQVTVLRLNITDLNRIFDTNPKLGVRFLRSLLKDLAKRLRDVTAKLRGQIVFGS